MRDRSFSARSFYPPFVFTPYEAVWRSREDGINAVVCIPVIVRSAPDDDGDVRVYMESMPMLNLSTGRVDGAMHSHIRLPLAELVLDV